MTFKFQVREGEYLDSLSLEEAVFQALGAASMCWDNIRDAGTFRSEEAEEIGEALLDYIRNYNNKEVGT